MKKNKRKIINLIGITTISLTSASIVVSCSSKTDQQKLNEITDSMIKDALGNNIDFNMPPSQIKKNTYNLKINDLSNVVVQIKSLFPNDFNGSLVLKVSISHANLTPPKNNNFVIELTGLKQKTDQEKIDAITTKMIHDLINNEIKGNDDPKTLIPENIPRINQINLETFFYLSDFKILISYWAPNNNTGQIKISAAIFAKHNTLYPSSKKLFYIVVSGLHSNKLLHFNY